MFTAVTLWWLGFFTAMGLCIGSFLNAVIHRLPRMGTLRSPRWSTCPACRHRIHWYDNLPIISFVLLRGRCRHCGAPIATRYVVVEAGMAVVTLMLLDTFFIAQHRAGLLNSPVGLTEELSSDWPMLLSHVILFACLFAMSAIDLEHYWVDIRFTNLATCVGFATHALWTPRHSAAWVRPDDRTAVACLLASFGLGLVWLVLICRAPPEEVEEVPSVSDPVPADETAATAIPMRREHWYELPSRAFAWASCLLLIWLFIELFLVESGRNRLPFTPRGITPLVLFFLLILRESTVVRGSDQEIVDAIEQERVFARRVALEEFALLLPALVLGALGWWLMSQSGDREITTRISNTLHSDVGWGRTALFRHWTPLFGLATAATGYVIAGALGWALRIVFTLILGKEAFGTGDIHLMAAAGCVAGWPVAVIGFFLTCLLALLGWVLVMPFKRSRALPLGPWLSLSFLAVVVFYEPIVRSPLIRSFAALASLASGVMVPP